MEEIKKRLHPDTIKANLLRASMFLTAFELLKSEIIKKPRQFLSDFNGKGFKVSSEYKSEILALDSDLLKASCLWLVKQNALTQEQLAEIEGLRYQRNEIAHELPKILIDPRFGVDWISIEKLRKLIATLGRYWGRIHVEVSPEYDGQDVKDEDIQSGSMLLVNYIADILKAGST